MVPLALALSLWGGGAHAPQLQLSDVILAPAPSSIAPAAPVAAPSDEPSTGWMSFAEGGIAAGVLVLSEAAFLFPADAYLALINFQSFVTLSAAQLAGLVALSVVGAVMLPLVMVGAVCLASRWVSDPRPPEVGHALIGAYAATIASVALAFIYAAVQASQNLSDISETVPALLTVAFPLVAIPIATTVGLHWDWVPRPAPAPLVPASPAPTLMAPPAEPPPAALPPAPSPLPRALVVPILGFSFS